MYKLSTENNIKPILNFKFIFYFSSSFLSFYLSFYLSSLIFFTLPFSFNFSEPSIYIYIYILKGWAHIKTGLKAYVGPWASSNLNLALADTRQSLEGGTRMVILLRTCTSFQEWVTYRDDEFVKQQCKPLF